MTSNQSMCLMTDSLPHHNLPAPLHPVLEAAIITPKLIVPKGSQSTYCPLHTSPRSENLTLLGVFRWVVAKIGWKV